MLLQKVSATVNLDSCIFTYLLSIIVGPKIVIKFHLLIYDLRNTFWFFILSKMQTLSREIVGNHLNATFQRFCPNCAVDFTSLKPLCMKFSGWITIQVDIIKIFNIVAICRHHLLDPVWYNKNQQNMCIFYCIGRHYSNTREPLDLLLIFSQWDQSLFEVWIQFPCT